MDTLDNFYTDHPFVDWYKQCRTKDILSIFQKGSVFGLDDYTGRQKKLFLGAKDVSTVFT